MARQFDGAMCVLCSTQPSSPTGEHVLPRWLMEEFPSTDGPYVWYVNGEAVQNRDGPRGQTSAGAAKLPVCACCNGKLNTRFEEPAKPIMRDLMGSGFMMRLNPSECEIVGLWLLKTSLLLGHPQIRHSEPGLALPRWEDAAPELYAWIVTDQPPPDGLSVWIMRRSESSSSVEPQRRVLLPEVSVDGNEVRFLSLRWALKSLDISVVYHPGWEIEHPLEMEGRALRIWPRVADESADLSPLPPVNPNEFNWAEGPKIGFLPSCYKEELLPPLSKSFSWYPLPQAISHLIQSGAAPPLRGSQDPT